MYGWVLAVSAGMLLIMFISRSSCPFGDKVLRYADDDQPFGFLDCLQRTFFMGSNSEMTLSPEKDRRWCSCWKYLKDSELLSSVFRGCPGTEQTGVESSRRSRRAEICTGQRLWRKSPPLARLRPIWP